MVSGSNIQVTNDGVACQRFTLIIISFINNNNFNMRYSN